MPIDGKASRKLSMVRPIDEKRIQDSTTFIDRDPNSDEKWYLHSILTQCFLPYQDPKQSKWVKTNGDYGVVIQSGVLPDKTSTDGYAEAGIPYGAKPRLITCYLHTYAVKNNTKVIPVERSISGFMKTLGFKVTGGKNGTIKQFQNQSIRLASCKWTIWGNRQEGDTVSVYNAETFKRFDLWLSPSKTEANTWPKEIELTSDFYDSLKEHAIPFDYRALKLLRANPRAQDIYVWLTQRLHRIPKYKPLELKTQQLHELFGGGYKELRKFSPKFDECLKFALMAYPEACVEKTSNHSYIFKSSPPPIKKLSICMN